MESNLGNTQTRVLIVDDHPLLREGLRFFLEEQGCHIAGLASNGEEAVLLARQLVVDAILLDLQMPVKDGFTALQEILRDNPKARVIILSNYAENDLVSRTLQAGAAGYILKLSPPEKVMAAIQAVKGGGIYLDPAMNQRVEVCAVPASGEADAIGSLTHRELEVLYYLAQGLPNKDIARELNLSIRTVTTHVRNIMEKLHLPNRTRTALYAREHNIFARQKPKLN